MSKTLISTILPAMIVGISLSVSAHADGCKIGVVDMSQILQNAPMMKEINNQLSKTFTGRQNDLNAAKTKLQTDTKALSDNSQGLDDAALEKLQDKIIYDKSNIAISEATLEKDLTVAKKTQLKKFMEKFSAVVQKIAKDGGYDLIEQKTNVVYLSDKVDLTQQVLKQLT